ELQSGDILTGTIVEQTDEYVIVDHPVLGQLSIPREQIAVMPTPPTDVEAVEAAEEAAAAADPVVQPSDAPWESQIDVGFSGATGNTENIDLRASFLTIQESDTHRWRIDAAYYY